MLFPRFLPNKRVMGAIPIKRKRPFHPVCWELAWKLLNIHWNQMVKADRKATTTFHSPFKADMSILIVKKNPSKRVDIGKIVRGTAEVNFRGSHMGAIKLSVMQNPNDPIS